jgi:hypothetical protein
MYYLRFCPLEWITEKSANNITTVAGGLRQRLRGHQSLQEASLLSKPAATQRTQVQRLSPENKGGLPYITFRAGYRNGGYSLFHT